MSQAWVEYQFRHPEKYSRITYKPDSEWQRLYRSILANKAAGGEFEQSVLKAHGYEKNTLLLMPPPGSEAQGFIADSVLGHSAELVWGKPYRFVEVKGREETALTGNLEAMVAYVKRYGGSIEVWFRSAEHSKGQTRLTKPLEREMRDLINSGKADVQYFP
jgi:hypothetical protein